MSHMQISIIFVYFRFNDSFLLLLLVFFFLHSSIRPQFQINSTNFNIHRNLTFLSHTLFSTEIERKQNVATHWESLNGRNHILSLLISRLRYLFLFFDFEKKNCTTTFLHTIKFEVVITHTRARTHPNVCIRS